MEKDEILVGTSVIKFRRRTDHVKKYHDNDRKQLRQESGDRKRHSCWR